MYASTRALISLLLTLNLCQGKMIRNSALMNQMMHQFHKEKHQASRETAVTARSSEEPLLHVIAPLLQRITHYEKNPERILSLMQSVLCRSFPSIPCNVIMQDPKLKKIIAHSIQDISNKERGIPLHSYPKPDKKIPINPLHKTTQIDVPLVPVTELPYQPINSENLSTFLAVAHSGYFQPEPVYNKQKKNRRLNGPRKNYWSKEQKNPFPSTDTQFRNDAGSYGQPVRTFYPSQMYKKQNIKTIALKENSRKVHSKSREVPVIPYNADASESPVWRLDYMTHAMPNVNKYGYEDEGLLDKLTQTANNVLAKGNALAGRKDVLHTDIYIKNNFNRKKNSRSLSQGTVLE